MNRKLINKIIIIIIVIFAFTLLYVPKAMAGDSDPDADIETADYKVGLTYKEGEYFFKKAGKVLTILRSISIMVALICLSIIGIKYMVGSIDEKANYKEKLLPVAIGCILIAGLNSLLLAINSIMNS